MTYVSDENKSYKLQKVLRLTLISESAFCTKSLSLSILHFMVTSCPTRSPLEGRGRKPTARKGSSTGRCRTRALRKSKSFAAPLGLGSLAVGAWAPLLLLPEIPYLILTILSVLDASALMVIIVD